MTPRIPRWLSAALTSAALVAAVTAVIALLEPRVPALGLGVLYLMAVVPISLVYGAAVGGAVAVASMVAFDFFFLAPRHNLDPGTSEQWGVLVAFLVSSLLVSQLAARAQREARRSARLAEEHAALRRVATLVAHGTRPEEVFAAVVEEVGRLLAVDVASLCRYESDGTLSWVASWGTAAEHFPVGSRRMLGGKNVSTIVFETGLSARIDNFAESSSGPIGVAAREAGINSSLATPIMVEGRLWGVIAAGSTQKQPVPADTEARLANFTELVATAIANAESRAELARLAEEQAALRRVATLVARGVPPEELFAAVAQEVGQLLPVGSAAMGRYDPDGMFTTVAAWSAGTVAFPVGNRWLPEGKNVTTIVFETGRPARIDDFADASGPVGVAAREAGYRSAVGTPIIVEGRLWGVMTAASSAEPLPADTEARLASFTELVATAIANVESRADLAASRARIVAASDETRRRIERDLHDGPQQRLVSLSLELRSAEAAVPAELEEPRTTIGRVAEELDAVIDELLEISRGIHPAILSEGGLGPALRTLARRSAIPIEFDGVIDHRLPESIEVAAYYVVSEALTNAAKHSNASRVEVDAAAQNRSLRLSIRDDGVGGADPGGGSGLVGLRDRVEALGGSIQISSPPGDGTHIVVRLPLALDLTGDRDPHTIGRSDAPIDAPGIARPR